MIQLSEDELNQLANQKYLIKDHFLPKGWALELLETLRSHIQQQNLIKARIGNPNNLNENTQIRGDFIRWLSQEGQNPAEKFVLQALNEVRNQLKQELLLPLRWIEAHYAFYPVGQVYEKHWDNFKGGNARQMTFVFYLNDSWQTTHGGELVLFDPDDDTRELKKIEPLFNRIVLFKSDSFPHQVNQAQTQRLSLTGWIRSDAEPTFA